MKGYGACTKLLVEKGICVAVDYGGRLHGIKMMPTPDWQARLYKNETAEQRSTLGAHLIVTPA